MTMSLPWKGRIREMTNVNREHHQWFSPYLQRDMELLIFGHSGDPVLFFPTRTARFYDYEDWGVIDALEDKISNGLIQVYCVDSVDDESFYCKTISPAERILRHNKFENYMLYEVMPFAKQRNNNARFISAGCSLGAYHAVNIAFRHPQLFKKVIGMSGRYDLTHKMNFFEDLFEGYWDENIYFNMPGQYIPNMYCENQIAALRKLEIILVIGIEDAFLENNLELSKSLTHKDIRNTVYYQEGEAHKACYWGALLNRYI